MIHCLRQIWPGDLLVRNDTRVRPWRLCGRRKTGGKVECLILQLRGSEGEGFVKPSKKLAPGESGMRLRYIRISKYIKQALQPIRRRRSGVVPLASWSNGYQQCAKRALASSFQAQIK